MTPDPLCAFVEARLAEREALGLQMQAALDNGWNYFDEPGDFDAGWMLRDVAAKRAILAEHWAHSEPELWIDGPKAGQATGRTVFWCSTCDQDRDYGYISGPQEGCATLRHLAAIDAGHPDYDPAWAPVPA